MGERGKPLLVQAIEYSEQMREMQKSENIAFMLCESISVVILYRLMINLTKQIIENEVT